MVGDDVAPDATERDGEMTQATTNDPAAVDDRGQPAEGARAPKAPTEGGAREGSTAVVEALEAGGVEIVFGYTGGAVPALFRSLLDSDIRTIAGKTELNAAWMSYGYNRVKRRAASGLLTWVVGALHASPAVYASKLDGNPLLMITVNNPPAMEARDGLQDAVELYSALKPLAKYIKKVSDAGDLPVIVRQAIKEASTGRFGPSVLDLAQTAMFQETTMAVEPLVLPSPPAAQDNDVAQTLELISHAERPVLYVGAGVHLSDAAAELLQVAERLAIPVVSTSWGGRGLLPDRHELYAGPSGNFGWRCANDVLQQSDLWVAVGVSFSQMSTASWSLKKPSAVVHVDVDAYEVGKIFQPTVGAVADAKDFLTKLLAFSGTSDDDSGAGSSARQQWVTAVAELKEAWLDEMRSWFDGSEVPVNQYFLIKTLSEQLPDDALVVGDSGGQAFALYRAYEYRSVSAPPTGGRYMSLGAGLPVAIGAKLAAPERVVVSYHGDGGFYYDLSELATLKQHGIKVVVIIDNNRALLANRASARATGVPNPWADLPETTDLAAVARGFGVEAETIESPDELAPAIQRALAAEGSYLLDVRTDSEMRLVRAVKGMIPIVGDRTPKAGHLATVIEGSWPS
jgi:acetolactate synthase I/II/III large subunit